MRNENNPELIPLLKNLTANDILTAYSGKHEGCRCGCLGEYYVTVANRAAADADRGYAHDDDDVSDKQVTRILRKVQNGNVDSITPEYANVTLETGRVYTVYFLKPLENTFEALGKALEN